jgi:hypothetical protein
MQHCVAGDCCDGLHRAVMLAAKGRREALWLIMAFAAVAAAAAGGC